MLIIFIEPKIITSDNDIEKNAQFMCKKFHNIYQKNNKNIITCPLRKAFFANNDIKKINNFFDYKNLINNFYNHGGVPVCLYEKKTTENKTKTKEEGDYFKEKSNKKKGPRRNRIFKKKEIIHA